MNRRAFPLLTLLTLLLSVGSCVPASSPAWKTSDFTVKLHRLLDVPNGSGDLASLLRTSGYDVVVISDTESRSGNTAKENYSVIWIGKEVPVPVAAKAIQLTG